MYRLVNTIDPTAEHEHFKWGHWSGDWKRKGFLLLQHTYSLNIQKLLAT